MDIYELKRKTEYMLECLREYKDGILEYFPHIVDDLDFYINEYPNLLLNYDECDLYDNLVDLQKTRIEYFSIVISSYMELIWKRKFKYEIDITPVTTTGSYDHELDLASFYILTMLVDSNNTCDIFRTIFHEFKHALQHDYKKETNIGRILEYPPEFFTITKNDVPNTYNIFTEKNYEILLYCQGRQYYKHNYKTLYTELDAHNYGLKEAKNFLSKLYEIFPNKNKNIEEQISKIEKQLKEESYIVIEDLKQENKLDQLRLEEITTNRPITSTISFDYHEEDALLFTDKVFREHMELIELNPVLKLLVDDDRIKTYEEILEDKERYSKEYDKSKVDKLYEQIIRTSPMLLISKYIKENDIDRIYKFLEEHPTFINEYQEEIKELEMNNEIRELLKTNKHQKKKNYGIIM